MIDLTHSRCRLRHCFLTTLALGVFAVGARPVAAQGLDRIRDRNGITTGKITKMSALGVTLTKNGVDTRKPVEEIMSITFAGEPSELAPARRSAKAGRFKNALEKLQKIDRAAVDRTEIAQEIEFLQTFCGAQLALSGQGALAKARQQVTHFLSRNSKSYRVPEAIELLGDLLLTEKNYTAAQAQYTKLGKAPAPYFQARSAILLGRLLQAEGKHPEAVTTFDRALQAAKGNTVAQSQVLEATLHRAVSQSALGSVGPSTDMVKKIIAKTDVTETKLLAQAYNALGDCYLQAQEKKRARQAFLHVDLLFSSAATEHAKALYELSQLWDDLGQPARARDAEQRLQEKYPSSRWAQR